jgi:transcriptional regulator with XRE-family HTH domain
MNGKSKRPKVPPNRLRELRQAQGLTLASVAGAAKIGATSLAHYELGTRKLAVPKLEILAKVLQVTSADILNESPEYDVRKLTRDEKEIVKLFRRLAPHRRKLVIRFIGQWNARRGGQKKAKRATA